METYIDNPKLEQNYIFSHSKTKFISFFFFVTKYTRTECKRFHYKMQWYCIVIQFFAKKKLTKVNTQKNQTKATLQNYF